MNPIIVYAGPAQWATSLRELVEPLGFVLKHYASTENYLNRLVADHAAFIVVHGADPHWRHWTTSPKVNSATRRIPVMVTAVDPEQLQAARIAGADFTLSIAELDDQLPGILEAHARVLPEAELAELVRQCAGSLPSLAREGIEQFNVGQYYKQHDLFEELWMEEEGPVRDLYRAILQVGVAYYQVQLGNRRGALKMLMRSLQWLNVLPDACQGIDVARLRADALRLRDALEALPSGADLATLDDDLLGRVHFVGEV